MGKVTHTSFWQVTYLYTARKLHIFMMYSCLLLQTWRHPNNNSAACVDSHHVNSFDRMVVFRPKRMQIEVSRLTPAGGLNVHLYLLLSKFDDF